MSPLQPGIAHGCLATESSQWHGLELVVHGLVRPNVCLGLWARWEAHSAITVSQLAASSSFARVHIVFPPTITYPGLLSLSPPSSSPPTIPRSSPPKTLLPLD